MSWQGSEWQALLAGAIALCWSRTCDVAKWLWAMRVCGSSARDERHGGRVQGWLTCGTVRDKVGLWGSQAWWAGAGGARKCCGMGGTGSMGSTSSMGEVSCMCECAWSDHEWLSTCTCTCMYGGACCTAGRVLSRVGGQGRGAQRRVLVSIWGRGWVRGHSMMAELSRTVRCRIAAARQSRDPRMGLDRIPGMEYMRIPYCPLCILISR